MVSKKKPLIDDGTWLNEPKNTERIVPHSEPEKQPGNPSAPAEKKGGCSC